MVVFVEMISPEEIVIRARAKDEEGDAIGDMVLHMGPGDDLDGIPFETFAAVGSGEVDTDTLRRV
jgi:hypothetical protein